MKLTIYGPAATLARALEQAAKDLRSDDTATVPPIEDEERGESIALEFNGDDEGFSFEVER